jgi:hypothetical protein
MMQIVATNNNGDRLIFEPSASYEMRVKIGDQQWSLSRDEWERITALFIGGPSKLTTQLTEAVDNAQRVIDEHRVSEAENETRRTLGLPSVGEVDLDDAIFRAERYGEPIPGERLAERHYEIENGGA